MNPQDLHSQCWGDKPMPPCLAFLNVGSGDQIQTTPQALSHIPSLALTFEIPICDSVVF